ILAQDFHYSQFYNAPIHLNPALTGVFNGDVRLQGNYRSQWRQVPVEYQTFTLAVDKKFIRNIEKSSFFAAGLGLNYDLAGDGNLAWTDVNLNASFTQHLSKGFFVTLGGQAAVIQRKFDEEFLRFADQFDPGSGSFNQSINTSETFATQNHSFADFSLGVNFHWQALEHYSRFDYKEKRSKVDLGVGLMHLAQPDQSFIEDIDVPLYRRLSAYVRGVLQIAQPLDLVAAFSVQSQGPYREYVFMEGLRIHLDRQPGKQIALQAGIGYRFNEFGDAYFPTVQIEYNALRVGLSYDINTSDFNIATLRNGGFEISAQYLFKKVRPVLSRRFCPII
ncbi:MAG: PorP/SprF family type IX secretion system membrane protein, partial [Bacteroidota bacterium]